MGQENLDEIAAAEVGEKGLLAFLELSRRTSSQPTGRNSTELGYLLSCVDRGPRRVLAEHVPGARARLLSEHGHLSLALGHYGEMLDDLIAGGTR